MGGQAAAALVALLAGVGTPGDPLAELEAQQQALFEHVAAAVVFIANDRAFGSGFFVDEHGLVLTSAHVVGKQQKVKVVLRDGRRLDGTVREKGRDETDLALVQLPLEGTPVLAFAGAELKVGAWAAAVGHGMGGIWAFTTGMVTNIYPLGAERPVFQTQIPLNPGNSGGPVVDRQGRVLGVVTSGIQEASSLNFAIRIEQACVALPVLAARCLLLTVRAPDGVPVFVDGVMVGKGPVVSIPATPRRYEVFAVIKGQMRKRTVKLPEERTVDLTAERR
jgi:serine protease Do